MREPRQRRFTARSLVARVVAIEPPWHVHRLERSIVARNIK
ncbi:hypothetical protein AB2I83_14190 [Escherichia coli]